MLIIGGIAAFLVHIYDGDVAELVDDATELGGKMKDVFDGFNFTEAIDSIPKPNLTGLIERIDGIEWPDFGFDFDDIVSFDGPRGGAGMPNGTATVGWKINREKDTSLELEIVNACTEDWYGWFYQAVEDWEKSDVLTLSSSVVTADPDCKPIDGVMKVCNSNYGDTGWKGINELLISGSVATGEKIIVSSVAKMNEYYVGANVNTWPNKIEDERRYTMCHEMGHGFGLNHLDENFMNEDLHSCMDYSSRPGNNLEPNPMDFNSLDALYSPLDNTRRLLRSHRNPSIPHPQSTTIVHNGVEMEKRVYYLLV